MDELAVSKEVVETKLHDDYVVSQYLTAVLHDSLFELDMFVKFQSLRDVFGHQIHMHPVDGIVDFILHPTVSRDSATLFRNKWNASINTFITQAAEEITFVSSSAFLLNGIQYRVHVPSRFRQIDTIVTREQRKVASLGPRVLQASVLELLHIDRVLLATVDLFGRCQVYLAMSERSFGLDILRVSTLETGKETTVIKLIEMRGEVYLVVARNFPPPYQRSSSLLYRWMQPEGFKLVQEIPAVASKDLTYFRHANEHYLIFADSVPVHISLEPKAILVYRSSGRRNVPFRLFQKVYFDDCVDVEVFEFGNLPDLYLIASNSSHAEVFHFTGENGFHRQHKLMATDILTTKPFMMDGALYLAVGQGVEADGSIIYKAIMKGSTLRRWHLHHWS